MRTIKMVANSHEPIRAGPIETCGHIPLLGNVLRLSEFSEHQTQEIVMADNSSSGFLGVLVGALVVVVLVVVVAFGTGMFGSKDTATLKVEAPKIGTNK